MKKENACKECPNRPFCSVYKRYGEVHSSTRCIELTNEMRGYPPNWVIYNGGSVGINGR